MNILIPSYVTDARPKGCGFSRFQVEKVIKDKSHQVHDLVWGNLLIRIYGRYSDAYVDIVATSRLGGHWSVSFAYRVFSDLGRLPIDELSPLEIVEQMASRFGRDVTLGGCASKFHLQQTIQSTLGIMEFVGLPDIKDEGQDFTVSAIRSTGTGAFEVALVFCFDTVKYANWHSEH
jgi:hypothetical protein